MLPLPSACRWIDSADASRMYWHASCIAVVRADGAVLIQWGQSPELRGRAATLAQGKRHVERWVSARRGLPPGKRAMAARERMMAVLPVISRR